MNIPAELTAQTYIVRCWPETDQAGSVKWRFSLESTAGQDSRRGFTNLAELIASLEHEAEKLDKVGT